MPRWKCYPGIVLSNWVDVQGFSMASKTPLILTGIRQKIIPIYFSTKRTVYSCNCLNLRHISHILHTILGHKCQPTNPSDKPVELITRTCHCNPISGQSCSCLANLFNHPQESNGSRMMQVQEKNESNNTWLFKCSSSRFGEEFEEWL